MHSCEGDMRYSPYHESPSARDRLPLHSPRNTGSKQSGAEEGGGLGSLSTVIFPWGHPAVQLVHRLSWAVECVCVCVCVLVEWKWSVINPAVCVLVEWMCVCVCFGGVDMGYD